MVSSLILWTLNFIVHFVSADPAHFTHQVAAKVCMALFLLQYS